MPAVALAVAVAVAVMAIVLPAGAGAGAVGGAVFRSSRRSSYNFPYSPTGEVGVTGEVEEAAEMVVLDS